MKIARLRQTQPTSRAGSSPGEAKPKKTQVPVILEPQHGVVHGDVAPVVELLVETGLKKITFGSVGARGTGRERD